ncbi:hypothetical protein MCOR23_003375 [Pyricularia oryzae]|nr:hypothetical protein MCOR23_003375 [Pyricularia oryzae]
MSVTKAYATRVRMRLGRVSAVDGLNGGDCKCYFVQGGQWATAIVRIAGSPASRCGGHDGAAVRAERCQCRYCQPSSQVQPSTWESRKVLLSFMIHALQADPKTSPAMEVVSKSLATRERLYDDFIQVYPPVPGQNKFRGHMLTEPIGLSATTIAFPMINVPRGQGHLYDPRRGGRGQEIPAGQYRLLGRVLRTLANPAKLMSFGMVGCDLLATRWQISLAAMSSHLATGGLVYLANPRT